MFDWIADITYRVLEVLDRPARTSLTSGGRPNGIALLLALVTIAIVSAAVVQYTYSTRVNLSMSVNSRDRLKSYFLARSGVSLARLLLNFQYALQNEADRAMRKQSKGQGGVSSCNPRMISTAMRKSNFQMHQYMDLLMRPFNSGKLETPVGGINLSDAGVEGFGQFAGEFDVDIAPEEGKVNVNQFAKAKVDQEDVQDLCALMQDSQYTDLFQREGEDGEPLDRHTVIQRIVDYIDLNETKLPLTDQCTLEERGSGDEGEPYAESDLEIEPRNAKLTHIAELYQVKGVSESFMRAFKDQLTVYPVGKPNANLATFPVFYSILCRNVTIGQGQTVSSDRGLTPCQASPRIRTQVMLFAMALDGIRHFFEDPLSVLMAYVGASQSRLLPSAKKGQPIAFLQSSQVHSYLRDLKRNPQLMARFLTFSPTYRRIVRAYPKYAVDPRNPRFPQWVIKFDRAGILRSVTTQTPSIYRIKSTGTYGNTQSTVETVIDFSKPIRRLPNEKQLEQRQNDSQQLEKLKKALRKRRKEIPKGRVLYWRENVTDPAGDDDDQGGATAGPGRRSPLGGPDAGGTGEPGDDEGGSTAGETTFGGGGAGRENKWDFDFNED